MSGITLRTDGGFNTPVPMDNTAPIGQSPQIGGGVNGIGSTPVPVVTGTPGYDSIMQSLRSMAPPPQTKTTDFEAQLAEVIGKLKDALGKVQESRANTEMETKRVNIQENQAKIEEAKKKLDEAEAKRNSSNIIDILSLVFEAIAAAALMIGGAIVAALPGGQAAGALMIVSGVMMMMSVANSVTAKVNDGAGLLGSIAKAAGADPDVIAGVDGAFTGALVLSSIALAVATGGASISSTMANMAKLVTTITNAVAATVQAGLDVASSAIKLDAAVDRKDAANARAESDEIQALMQMLDDLIDMAMSMLMQVNQNVQGMMDSLSEMLNDTGNTLSNTKFAG